MNDAHEDFSVDDDDDDQSVARMLAALKCLEPSVEGRLGNRVAVAEELGRLIRIQHSRQRPWWRRTIPVPVPVVAGLAASVLVVFLLTARSLDSTALTKRPVTPAQQTISENVSPPELTANEQPPPKRTPVLEYSATEIYVCGLGRVDSKSGYFFRE